VPDPADQIPKHHPIPPGQSTQPGHPDPSSGPGNGGLGNGPGAGGGPTEPVSGGPGPGAGGPGTGGPGGGGPGAGGGPTEPGAGGPGTGGGPTESGAALPGTGSSESPGYWDVDPDRLNGFAMAVTSARFGLAAVQTRVERMQGESYTPKLGTSPVGQQLAKKFDDRLNGDEGLRGLLAEAMRRMDQFIESAEKVRDAYREGEDVAQDSIKRSDRPQGG